MCGHGIIAVTKVVLETGMLPLRAPETMVKIDTPAGLVTAYARVKDGKIGSVYFHNVASFVVELDAEVEVPGLGKIRYDLAYGGAFYAYVQAEDAGVSCTPAHFRSLIEKGMAIKRAVMNRRSMAHPFEPDLNFLYGTIFISPPLGKARIAAMSAFSPRERSIAAPPAPGSAPGWPSTTPAERSASANRW